MSLSDQLDEIIRIKHRKPVKCVFCIDRDIPEEHGLWHFSAPADKIIQEYVTKLIGIEKCSHLKAGDVTIEMSDFIASILCNYIIKNHSHFQHDNEFIEGVSRDKDLMISLMEKYVSEKLSFDQEKYDETTAQWLMEKYLRFEQYKDALKEIVYV